MLLFRDQLQVVDRPDGILCTADGISTSGNIHCRVEVGKDKEGNLFVLLCEFISLEDVGDNHTGYVG